ncbi:MAG: histidine phosphatase family protein [Terrimicrobiaceae bacterium]
MKRIRLIRHAESQANAGYSTSDPASIELTETSWSAAREFAKAYDGPEPDLIVTSPYRRAQQTAQPLIERFGCRVEILEVHEFTYLSPARCRNTNSAHRRPMVEAYWTTSNPQACDGEGAESFEEFLERVERSTRVLREHDAATILVFTHEFFINAVRFFDLPGKPSATPESMRQFHDFSRQNPMANLGIHELESR